MGAEDTLNGVGRRASGVAANRPLRLLIGLGAIAATLAGCGTADPRIMRVGTQASAPAPSNQAVLMVDGTWQGLRVFGFDLGPNLNLRFQNVSLSAPPDLFDQYSGFGPGFAVVSPGTYDLIAAQQTDTSGNAFKFSLPASPVRFTVKAGDVVDVGHIVLAYDNGGNCAPGLMHCDVAIHVHVVPHGGEDRAKVLAALQRTWPGAGFAAIGATSVEVTAGAISMIDGGRLTYVTP